MIRSKYDGKKIYKVTMNEDEDSSQETLIDYGEFTDGTKKVDVSKKEPSKSGSGFGVRKIGGLLIGISGVMFLLEDSL